MIGLLAFLSACSGPLASPIALEAYPIQKLAVHWGDAANPLGLFAKQARISPGDIGEGKDVRLELKSKDPVIVRGDTSVWNENTGQVTFKGGVLLEYSSIELRCDQLELAVEEGILKSGTGTGSIRVILDRREGTATQIRLDLTGRTLGLIGDAVLEGPSQKMFGDEIIFDLEGKQVECVQCRIEWIPEVLESKTP